MRRMRLSLVAFAAMFALAVLIVGPVGASPTKVPGSSIPVDADAYYKSLTGKAAEAKIKADAARTQMAAGEGTQEAAAAARVGDVKRLYADGVRQFTLKAIGGNCEIWVANDLSYPAGDPRPTPVVTQQQVDYLFAEYNNNIYPQMANYYGMTNDRDGTGGLFGTPAWAGFVDYEAYATDNPQRMMILVFNIVDEAYEDPDFPFYTAGYFWPAMTDDYVNRNIIHIDSHDWANRIGPEAARPYLYEQVFTHEFEHAIHYDHDPGEPSWVDEGLADLAPYLVGYGHSAGHIAQYLALHRTPLTVWGGGLEDYGESYLFQLYLLENFGGPDFVKGLVNDSAKGIAGIENQIAAQGYGASFDEVYRDWTVANYLDDPSLTGISGGQLGYDNLDIPSVDTMGYSIQWSVKNYYGSDHKGQLPLPRYYPQGSKGAYRLEWPNGDLMPYAPLYSTYGGMSPLFTSSFKGADASGIAAYQGSYELWGGRGDLINTKAVLADAVTLGSNATLSFWANYKIEEAWDFGFVQISTDDGTTWTSLENADTTSVYDPSAHPDVIANVPGFTGSSDGWREEVFDLAAYAGEDILIRFMYITDWAYNEDGFYVDEVSIADDSGTIFSDDLETSGDAWMFDGWLRTTGLAQNDWGLTFLNPSYLLGKFAGYEITEKYPYTSPPDINGVVWQRDSTSLNTVNLNKGEVTVIVSNHLPEATSFPSFWQLLVSKGNAKK